MTEFEDSVVYYLEKIEQWNLDTYDSTVNRTDSNAFYNHKLQEYLLIFGKTSSSILDKKYKKLFLPGMDIATSEDGCFRIYSWNNWSGGTMRSFSSVAQYRTKRGVETKLLFDGMDDSSNEWQDPGFFYSKISTQTNANGGKYYLAIRNGIYSSRDVTVGVQAFTIEDGGLNDSVRIFHTAKDSLNSIDCGYVWGGERLPIKVSKNKLYIPLIDGEKVTGRSLIYKFDGDKFVYDKNAH